MAVGDEDAVGLVMGNDVFGIGYTKFGVDPEEGIADWYGIEDYVLLLQDVFADPCDPCDVVVIELEACYSAGSIGKAFKRILPDVQVWGYTGKCKPLFPYLWETWSYTNSEWVEVEVEH